MMRGWLVRTRENSRRVEEAWVMERKADRVMPRSVGTVGLILLWWTLCGAWTVGTKTTSGLVCSPGSPERMSRTFGSREVRLPRLAKSVSAKRSLGVTCASRDRHPERPMSGLIVVYTAPIEAVARKTTMTQIELPMSAATTSPRLTP